MDIALVTWSGLPDLSEDDHILRNELRRMGMSVSAVAWDDANIDWESFDTVVLRSTWDYHTRGAEFLAWLDALEGANVWNPVALLRKNIHKGYLLELEAKGIPVVPTVLVPRGSTHRIEWPRVVVKPAVSANGWKTSFLSDAEDVTLAAEDDLLVQPLVDEIARGGEWSFVFIGGAYSHAVLKRPARGDFRVQTTYGGSAVAAAPPERLISQANQIVAAIDEPWLYARVDGVDILGRLVLMELELTEPSLFFDLHPQAAQRFGNALSRIAKGGHVTSNRIGA